MGLADFLADAAPKGIIGGVARAVGGKTTAQRELDDFINNQLPALSQEIAANTDHTKIPELQTKFMGAAAKAGIPVAGIEKLMEMTIKPHLQGIRAEGLNQLFQDYGPQAGSPRPQGGDALVKGPDIPATPARPLDQPAMGRIASLMTSTGQDVNPLGYQQLLETPAVLEQKQALANKEKTEAGILQRKDAALQGLSQVPRPGTSVSPYAMGAINPSGLVQDWPTRELSDSGQQLAREKLNVQSDAAANRAQHAGDMADIARAKLELDRQKTEQQVSGEKPMTDAQLRQQYQKAVIDREKLRRNDLVAAISGGQTEGYDAADANVKALKDELVHRGLMGGIAGQSATPQAPQPTGQGRYSQGVPTGSAPAPAQAGRGSAPAKPKRIKFDVNGNQIP